MKITPDNPTPLLNPFSQERAGSMPQEEGSTARVFNDPVTPVAETPQSQAHSDPANDLLLADLWGGQPQGFGAMEAIPGRAGMDEVGWVNALADYILA